MVNFRFWQGESETDVEKHFGPIFKKAFHNHLNHYHGVAPKTAKTNFDDREDIDCSLVTLNGGTGLRLELMLSPPDASNTQAETKKTKLILEVPYNMTLPKYELLTDELKEDLAEVLCEKLDTFFHAYYRKAATGTFEVIHEPKTCTLEDYEPTAEDKEGRNSNAIDALRAKNLTAAQARLENRKKDLLGIYRVSTESTNDTYYVITPRRKDEVMDPIRFKTTSTKIPFWSIAGFSLYGGTSMYYAGAGAAAFGLLNIEFLSSISKSIPVPGTLVGVALVLLSLASLAWGIYGLFKARQKAVAESIALENISDNDCADENAGLFPKQDDEHDDRIQRVLSAC